MNFDLIGQNISLNTNQEVSLIVNKGDFVVITIDSIYRINDTGVLVKPNLNKTVTYKHIQVFPDDGLSSYLINRGGGEIFEFYNDTIRKIDATYKWKSRFNSYDFIRDKIIHSYGGYGYHSFHNNIIQFDTIIKDWNPLITINNINKNSKKVVGLYQDDKLRLILGKKTKLNPKTQTVDQVVHNKIVQYSFLTKTWTKSKLNSVVHNYFNTYGKSYRRIKNYDIPAVYNVNSKLVTFDFNNEKVNFYSPAIQNISNINKMMFNKKSRKFGLIYSVDGKRYFDQVGENVMLDNLTKIEDLYQITFRERLNNSIPIILIFTILIALLYFYKYRRKVKTDVIFNTFLNDQEIELVNVLLSTKGFVTYPNLISEINIVLSYEGRLKRLNKLIADIEKKFNSEIKAGFNFFVIRRNFNDKRIKEIKISTKSLLFLKKETLK